MTYTKTLLLLLCGAALLLTGGVRAADDDDNPPLVPDRVIHLNTDAEFNAYVESHQAERRLMVSFIAPWCGFCKQLKPIWRELAKAEIDNADVDVIQVDATLAKGAAAQFAVRSYPTITVIHNGFFYDYARTAQDTLDKLREFAAKSESELADAVGVSGIHPLPKPPTAQEKALKVLAMLRADAQEMWRYKKNICIVILLVGVVIGYVLGKRSASSSVAVAAASKRKSSRKKKE